MDEKYYSDTILYVLTFVSIVVLVGSFATHLITGDTAFIQMNSMAGSALIGIVLFCYLCWFVLDTKVKKEMPLGSAIKFNLRHNPAVICMYFYGIVFILVSVFLN